jgi:hypothetical protein
MADDDEMMEPDEGLELDDDAEGPDLDEAELEVEELDETELDEDSEFGDVEEEFEEEEEADETAKAGPVRRSVTSEEEDEDDDMIAPDDVEADLDTILKDRLVAAEDEVNEDEEEVEERGEQADRLQPKRADEQLCPRCFLLVRQTAPMCPVGDDDCPLFSH